MKIKLLCIALLCNFALYSQEIGDYKSINSIDNKWSNASSWLIFNGTDWVAATMPPCFNTVAQTITISKNTHILCNFDCSNYPIQTLIVEENAVLEILNKDFIIEKTLKIYGTLQNSSSIGKREFNDTVYIYGNWYSQEQNTFLFNDVVFVKNASIYGDYPSTFECKKNVFFKDNIESTIEKAEIITDTCLIQGIVSFTSVSGQKICNTLLIEQGELITEVGETFVCNWLSIKNGSIKNRANAIFQVSKNMTLENASFPNYNDFIAAYNITQNLIVIEKTLNYIESGEFNIDNDFIIEGGIYFTGKVGTKTCKNNVLITNTGQFVNQDNETFSVYGNFENNGVFTPNNGRFYFEGTDKTLCGNLFFRRLYINGTYTLSTTNNVVEIASVLDGKGVLNIPENKTLKTFSYTSCQLTTAQNSTVEYCNADSSILKCSEYFNILFKAEHANYILSNNCEIENALHFCNGSKFILNNCDISFNNQSVLNFIYNTDSTTGFICKNSKIYFNNIEAGNTIKIPSLNPKNTNQFILVTLKNISNTAYSFSCSAITYNITQFTDPNSETQNHSNIAATFTIETECPLSQLNFYWNFTAQLPAFDIISAQIIHYKNSEKEYLESTPVALTEDDLYFTQCIASDFSPYTVGNNNSLLPVTLTDFSVITSGYNTHLQWETHSETDINYYEIYESENGIDFTFLSRVHALNSKEKTIYTTEIESNSPVKYYKLTSTNIDGSTKEYKIISVVNNNIVVFNNTTNTFIINNPENKKITILLCQPDGKYRLITDVSNTFTSKYTILSYKVIEQSNEIIIKCLII